MNPTPGLIRSLAKDFAELYSVEQLQAARKALIAAGGKRITTWSDIGISSTAYFELDTPTQLAILRKALFLRHGGKLKTKPNRIFLA